MWDLGSRRRRPCTSGMPHVPVYVCTQDTCMCCVCISCGSGPGMPHVPMYVCAQDTCMCCCGSRPCMTSRLRGAEQAWPDPWVHVFDYESGKEVECLKGHHGHVWDVAFAPDGATYCSGADDGMPSRCALLLLCL